MSAKQPDWFEIISLCGQKMELKTKKFGDSWCTCDTNQLLSRIRAETDELDEAVLRKDHGEIMAECIDVINQTAMLYSRMSRLRHQA